MRYLCVSKYDSMMITLSFSRILMAALVMCSDLTFSQRKPNQIIESSYTDGESGFFERLGKILKYPAEARTKGVMGLSVVSFKVGCDNVPHSFIYRTKLGFGIEEELQKAIEKTNNWLVCDKRDSSQWINLKVAFSLNNLYYSKDSDLDMNAMGSFPGVSDDQLKTDLEKALKKQKSEKAISALTKLLMRFPYDLEYKKKLQELLKEKT